VAETIICLESSLGIDFKANSSLDCQGWHRWLREHRHPLYDGPLFPEERVMSAPTPIKTNITINVLKEWNAPAAPTVATDQPVKVTVRAVLSGPKKR